MQSRVLRLLGLGFALLLMGCGASEMPRDGGARDAATDVAAEVQFLLRPVSIDTVAPENAVAGQPLRVECLLRDERGEAFPMPDGFMPNLLFAPALSVVNRDGMWVPTRAGELTVTCSAPAFSLVDATPARVRVSAGPVARVVARSDRSSVPAGENVNITCEAFDAYGNAVAMPPSMISLAPMQAGNEVMGNRITPTRAGLYDVSCVVPGAMSEPTQVEVRPGAAAELQLSRVPDQPVYSREQVIEVKARVTDQYGNEIPDADVNFSSAPNGTTLGDGRFRYAMDGSYVVTARVGMAACMGSSAPLCKTTTIVVDSDGPGIVCGPNANGSGAWDGTAINGAVGATLNLVGRVSDTSTVRSVQVNGRAVTVTSGSFPVTLMPREGVNFVDVTAIDGNGRENSRTCSFLYGNRWLTESSLMTGAVALQLRQPAMDDGDPISPITSLDDMLQTVLNSQGLRDTLHRALLDSNPIKASSCDASVLGACVFRSEITYLDSTLTGTRTSSLTLVDGGLRLSVTVPLLRVRLQVRGTLDTTGWVAFENVTASAIFDLSLSSARRPQVRVRSGSVTSSVGRVNPDFPGISGVIIDVVASIAQGRLRDLVNNTLRSYLSTELNGVLDSVVGGLSISTLGSSFNVPRIEGTGNVRLDFGVDFSSVNATTQRLLIGIGTRFSPGTITRMTPTPGVWQRAGTTYLLDPTNTQPAAVALHTGVLNQALNGLWRGGFFDARIAGGSLGTGVVATIRTGLPPITQPTSGGMVALELGALDVELLVPGIFDPPLRVRLGATATTRVSLMGNSLQFAPVTIGELHFSLPCDGTSSCQSLSAANRMQLEMFLRRVLQQVADTSLSRALPAIPIPTFPIPASLAPYGLPAGSNLGVTMPALTLEGLHYVLRARFGIR